MASVKCRRSGAAISETRDRLFCAAATTQKKAPGDTSSSSLRVLGTSVAEAFRTRCQERSRGSARLMPSCSAVQLFFSTFIGGESSTNAAAERDRAGIKYSVLKECCIYDDGSPSVFQHGCRGFAERMQFLLWTKGYRHGDINGRRRRNAAAYVD